MMSPFYTLEPEVAGRWGDNTIADNTGHPPVVSTLHHIFDGWLGDSIVESFPCFLITNALGDAIVAAELLGYELRAVEAETSDQFAELYPNRVLPEFRWLHVTGVARIDDFGISSDNLLIVSSAALVIIRQHGCDNCEINTVS